MKIKRRKISRIIRYVNYNKNKDKENYFRERLMLFRPWKNEEQDLLDKYDSYEDSYKAYKKQIIPNQKKYERYNDLLEEAVKEVDANPETDNEDDENTEQVTVTNLPDYAYFDPQRDERLLRADLASDMRLNLHYDSEVDLFGTHMNDQEYLNIMRSLNKEQSEILVHIMHNLQNVDNKMYIFIEGGAGVGKIQVANALNASIIGYIKDVIMKIQVETTQWFWHQPELLHIM